MIEVRLRPLAEADLVERTTYYRLEGGDELGGRFFDTAIEGLQAIQRMPGAGSPRIGELCDVPGLRSHRVTGFPCGWLYLERVDYVDVVRLLAYAQELATILGDLDENG
ncbi:MAG: type II toxin-antitoxin system RelE/ParE family toxin [Acidimicrobiia bacterium]|nr:type II toxin-antitoxin system RelE/ParE family toxin [Acidimicrobiia bacterium]